ncbi:flippase [Pontibacter flavimaris]|uniref:flippase n=1 Tax=Pontibacter flavimaris TaxID=1797110 RepID=UPI00147C73EE|nr:flippase [Pontibacter flavimaris]
MRNTLSKFSIFAKSDYKPLVSNFLSLGLIQVANFLLSIATFPYIVRVIGVERFGVITLLQTIMLYFVVLTDYGFNLSATKDISTNRNDKTRISGIFSEVMTTKLVLLLLSFIILSCSFILVPDFREHWTLTIFSFTIVLGQALQPTWFYQGIEKMKYITYINILNRILYAVGIFILISQPQDYLFINLINGISLIIGGVISLFIVFSKFGLQYSFPSLSQIRKQLVDSWNIFFATLTVSISNNTNILILGIFANPLVIGYYSIAEKVFQIMRTLATILYQVVYPRVCILAQESFEVLAKFLRKFFRVILVAFLPLSFLVFAFADYIVYLITGEFISEAALILRIICFGPFMAALNIPASQTMLAYKLDKLYTVVLTIGAVINVTLNFILTFHFQAVGTALSIMLTEIFITGLLYYALYRKYPHYTFFINSPLMKSTKV